MPETTCRCSSILGGEYAGAIGQVFEDNGKSVSDGGNDCPPRDEARANARLIAAAPDLLKACEEMLSSLEAMTTQGVAVTRWDEWRGAIAKARGGK